MKKQTHFLGIGGIGMSALAHILLGKGEGVSGSDDKKSEVLTALQKKGATIHEDHDAVSTVVYSSAIRKDHPVLQKALKEKCPIYHRSQFLSRLMEGKKPLLITGTHGKTSTSALLSWVLIHACLSPSYAVGGILTNTSQNGGYGNGPYFVAEADESDGSFLNYQGFGGIITNLESEHLDFWQTEKRLFEGFKEFASRLATFFWCIDDPGLSSLNLKGQSYGFSKEADWQLFDFIQKGMILSFSVSHQGQVFEDIKIPLVGKHQALNALAVWALALELGVPEEKIREAFKTFKGVFRRLEKKGEARGATVYDDYAHHPTEIEALLTALKKTTHEKRLIAIFQPHRYTRTQMCFDLFSKAFQAADLVYITEVYSACEKPIPGISGETLAESIPGALFVNEENLLKTLEKVIQKGDIVVTLGAGSITTLGPKLLAVLE